MILEDLQFKVPEKLFAPAESLHLTGELAKDAVSIGPDTYAFCQPITWEADVTNTGNALLISGTAQGAAECECSRCLEKCTYNLEGEIEAYYLLPHQEEEEDQEGEEEFEMLFEDGVIDLESLIVSSLILDMPVQPLCEDECLGLCPECGANLNTEQCECADSKTVDPTNPFAVLAGLKFD